MEDVGVDVPELVDDDEVVGLSVAGGGRGRMWRIPVIERVDRMDMRNLSIDAFIEKYQ